jgi:hypothetical protein
MSGRLLSKPELLGLLERTRNARKLGLSQRELEQVFTDFWAGCPDPVEARWLIAECPDPLTDEEVVDRALSMVDRPMSEVPTSIVPHDHPARSAA